jgi:autophagy-related protein 13
MSSPLAKMATTANFKELEKYVKHLFFKTSQIIVQSRQGGKSFTESQPNPKSQSWFSIAINDTSEISHESKKVVSGAQVSGQGILAMPLCIEISLKTTEGDLLVLETWVLSMKDSSDPTVR